jgi:hypothetical protein
LLVTRKYAWVVVRREWPMSSASTSIGVPESA